MNSQMRVMQGYTALLDVIAHMLVCAERADWDQVVSGGQDYLVTMEQLAEMESFVALDGVNQGKKRQMIEDIRATEKRLRTLLDDRMTTITDSVGALMQQNKVEQAYTTP